MKPSLLLALIAAPSISLAQGVALPFSRPERPFLLLDAEHRATPGPASVRVQVRGGGALRLSVFRVHDPAAWIARSGEPDGLAVSNDRAGVECEQLLAQSSPLPRRGATLELVRELRVTPAPPTAARRTGGDESEVYDSSDQDEGSVETRWVRAGRWSDQRVPVGALPEGLYLVRAHAGAWAANTLLPVSDLTLVARRGDAHDIVFAASAEGAPLAGVEVLDARGRRARTDARGEARFAAVDDPTRRFIAHRGLGWAWTDARHARLGLCDPRVYLDPGRPVFRPGETVHLRGHARGCVDGREAPLANERVELIDDDGDDARPVAEARTDRDGNFTATWSANHTTVGARLRGHAHLRTIQFDQRRLPTRSLRLTLDRGFAAAGETVRARAADDDGGWPTTESVSFEVDGRRMHAEVGPGRAAEVSFTVPTTDAAVRAITVTATLGVLSADTQLFTGRSPVLLHVEPERDVGATGDSLPLRLRAEDLGGDARPEEVSVEVFGSDGNRPVGSARWTGRARIDGDTTARATLTGVGPWWVTVRSTRSRDVTAGTVVWERDRPPTLGARGSLSVRAGAARAAPGVALPVDVLRPAGGATWVTLEQSGVWASAVIPAGAAPRPDGSWRAMLGVPETARGDLSVVATHLRSGVVSTATSVTRAVGSPATLTVEPERRVYPEGERTRVTVSSRDAEGRPVDGVISLWLADAGYWDLAEDRYPEPEALLNVPGRPASGSDSTHFIAWGSDEGRRVEVSALWNGTPLPRTTLYDAWTAGADTVDVSATGSLAVIARAIATTAGLRLGDVCDARVRAVGDASLAARNIPWDLLAARVAERTTTFASVHDGALRLTCTETAQRSARGLMGHGSGSGSGYGRGGLGSRGAREQTLEGDLYFLPLQRLGPTGRAVIEVPLPAHPGRWRLQGVVISDDGRGAHAHALVTTSRALSASVELPSRMRVGDELRGDLAVHAPSRAGQSAAISLTTRGVSVTAPPATVTLDARGDAIVPLSLTATRDGDGEVIAAVTSGAARDAVRVAIPVRDDVNTRALSVRAFVGESATDVDVPIPALSRPTSLRVSVDAGLADIFDDVAAALSDPRWDSPALYVDRLLALRALQSSLAALPERERAPRAERLDAMLRSTLSTLQALRSPDGGVAWWRAPSSSTWLSAVMVAALPRDARGQWADAVRFVTESARSATGDLRAAVAEALSHGDASERATATSLQRGGPRDGGFTLDGLSRGATTARRLALPAADQRAWTDALRAALDATTAQPAAAPCRGVAWFLCMSRDGDRGRVARAALALTELAALDAGGRARALTWLGLRPSERRSWTWGSAEADVLALLSRTPVSRAGARFVVRSGDRVLARGEGSVDVNLPAGGATTLRVSFEAARGRATRARVEGTVTMAPADATLGTAGLERRVDASAEGPTLSLRWTLPRETTGVELRVPLPSGVDLARPGGSRARVRATERDVMWWSALDRAPRALNPVVERDDGAIVLRMERLGAGAHSLTLPLVYTAAGRSHAGGATLRSDDPAVWGMTAPVAVESPAR